MKKSTHSKIKNTAILFELLTRQVAADTIKGVDRSPAIDIIKSFFKPNTPLAKELLLYQTLINEKYGDATKASHLLSAVIKLRNRLDKKLLKEQKYTLVREIKKHYDLEDFFKTNLTEYKLFASIYRVFEGVSIARVSEVVQSKSTILEHLKRKGGLKINEQSTIVDDYLKQEEDIRLLAYKLMIDKFNEKYAGLSTKQKAILKEYINNVSDTQQLKMFIVEEAEKVTKLIKGFAKRIQDPVTAIKLKEVCNLTQKLQKVKTIKEDHVLSLLLYHELLKELKSEKGKVN